MIRYPWYVFVSLCHLYKLKPHTPIYIYASSNLNNAYDKCAHVYQNFELPICFEKVCLLDGFQELVNPVHGEAQVLHIGISMKVKNVIVINIFSLCFARVWESCTMF